MRSAILLLAACVTACGPSAHKTELSVSIAASLQNAMAELAPLYEGSHSVHLAFNYGGSGTLEQQIEHGAPCDVFLSAAPKPMDALAAKGLIEPGTRRDLVRNDIVLIAPQSSASPVSFQDLPAVKLIALGEPASVPAGDYGRQVLQYLRLWDAVQSKLVLAKDVRQVLTYVETGNADAGIVYATDARDSGKVRIVDVAPQDSHTPVIYPAAAIKGSPNVDAARAFIAFLGEADSSAVFARHGFTAVAP